MLSGGVTEEVVDLLVVDLDEGAADQELLVIGLGHDVQDVLKRPGDDAVQLRLLQLPDHGVRFTTSRLPIGKNGAVIPLNDTLHQFERSLLINEGLRRRLPKHIVKGKGLNIVLLIGLLDGDLVAGLVGHRDGQAAPVLLLGVHWADTHHDFDCLAHRR